MTSRLVFFFILKIGLVIASVFIAQYVMQTDEFSNYPVPTLLTLGLILGYGIRTMDEEGNDGH